MHRFHIYIHFPSENLIEKINSAESYDIYMDNLGIIIDRADCETGAELYYSGSNVDEFGEAIALINEEFGVGNFDHMTVVNLLLQFAHNWEEKPKFIENEDQCLYRLWEIENRELISEFPPYLKEITEHKFLQPGENYILLNITNAFIFQRNFIPIFKDCRSSAINSLPQFIHILIINNFIELENWFEYKRIRRNYNFDDNRHIENHPDYRRDKSPILEGQNGKARLAELLITSITDQRAPEKISKDLLNFDIDKNCYVWFESENAGNQYHGYHVVKPVTHERDKETENIIPPRIKRILEYKLQINQYQVF